jgi:uncharacterized protein (TIGR03032 family)
MADVETAGPGATDSANGAPAPEARLEFIPSRQFPNWLAEQKLSLAFTTYQAGKLFLIGLQPDGRLSFFERTFNRCMGLWADGQSIWMSSLYQLWRFENTLQTGQQADGYDRLYLPQAGYTTGDLDIHDVAVDKNGRVVFVNTLFGCLATTDDRHSFRPLWQPPFITKLAAEDRCHLNGLAMRDGAPAYVTAVGETDVADGWRDLRRDGGICMDVRENEILARGLSMPHSPRWDEKTHKLWLLNAGTGELGFINMDSGAFEAVAFCPGFMRGLTIAGDFAIIGLSKQRENRTFSDLPLDKKLQAANSEARCALQVVDLRSGDVVHWLRIEGVVEELYDVVALPGVRRPSALGFVTDEIRRVITVADSAPPSAS